MSTTAETITSANLSGLPLGHFGEYGGRFVPEALVAALDELAQMHAQTHIQVGQASSRKQKDSLAMPAGQELF